MNERTNEWMDGCRIEPYKTLENPYQALIEACEALEPFTKPYPKPCTLHPFFSHPFSTMSTLPKPENPKPKSPKRKTGHPHSMSIHLVVPRRRKG